MTKTRLGLKKDADNAKRAYLSGLKTREETMKTIEEYINEVNKVAKEISKKYKRKYRKMTAIGYMR